MGNCVSAEEAPQAAAQQETSSKAAPIEEVAATTTPQGGEATTEPQEAVAENAAEPAELEEGASAEEANEEEKESFSTPAPVVVAAPVAEEEEKGTPPPAKVAAAPEEDDMETPCKVIITNQSKKLNIYPQYGNEWYEFAIDEKVAGTLRALGMEEYIPHLAYHQIDAATCAHLTDQDLREMNVYRVGHRRKLMVAFAKLAELDA